MTMTYELHTESHEYSYQSVEALMTDIVRFDPHATVTIYAFYAAGIESAYSGQYNVGKGAWQSRVYKGTIESFAYIVLTILEESHGLTVLL
jgi:hypothetical protein